MSFIERLCRKLTDVHFFIVQSSVIGLYGPAGHTNIHSNVGRPSYRSDISQ